MGKTNQFAVFQTQYDVLYDPPLTFAFYINPLTVNFPLLPLRLHGSKPFCKIFHILKDASGRACINLVYDIVYTSLSFFRQTKLQSGFL